MKPWEELFRQLADDPSDYEFDRGCVVIARHGKELMLELREIAGSGHCIIEKTASEETPIPLEQYVQAHLLNLPHLATQITRSLQRNDETAKKPVDFIEGPAISLIPKADAVRWESAGAELRKRLLSPDSGTTQIVELMAGAGFGKTSLLEHLSRGFAEDYRAVSSPIPIMLSIDLVGRNIGTIDDAIAGSLVNTLNFHGLSQKDVVLCIKQRWIILALDGFDELVGRIGAREAFNRLSQLIDQLDQSGCLIISAREAFFQLHDISASLNSYLRPLDGNYTVNAVTLKLWSRKQGIQVFKLLGSADPEAALDGLMRDFDGKEEIALHPFFLTRLAKLKIEGATFQRAAGPFDEDKRIKELIETFIEKREGELKWVDRNNQPLLTPEQHNRLLGCIAAEMWKTGSFRLTVDELRIATQLALSEMTTDSNLITIVEEKIPTHAALVPRDGFYSFIHDKFFEFFLGHRVGVLLKASNQPELTSIFSMRELGPEATRWVVWNARNANLKIGHITDVISRISPPEAAIESPLKINVGKLLSGLLVGATGIQIRKQLFSGDLMLGQHYSNIAFEGCTFMFVNCEGTSFDGCTFTGCKFSALRISTGTSFKTSKFIDGDFVSIDLSSTKAGGRAVFNPNEIRELLERQGAELVTSTPGKQHIKSAHAVRKDVVDCLHEFVDMSEMTCDVAMEDFEGAKSKVARHIVRCGKSNRVMREVNKDASGNKKTFVRFTGDRLKLLNAESSLSGDKAIDGFWQDLEKKYPAS